MEDHKPRMEVQLLSSAVIPHVCKDPSEVPLTIFDRGMYNFHTTYLFVFSPPSTATSVIIDALTETLVHFPTLTARLGTNSLGRRCIFLGDGGGALIVEASVDASLVHYLPLEPSPELLKLHPSLDDPPPDQLLQVQLTRFSCGGLIVGATVHHQVADGQSMSNFFVAWSRTARGLNTFPLPIYERPWLKPRPRPKSEFNKFWGRFFIDPSNKQQIKPNNIDPNRISNELLHYSPDFISQLKARVKSDEQGYTRFETLMGDLWRKITMARGLEGGQHTVASVIVNGRRRLQPPAPKEFFGNLAMPVLPEITMERLVGGTGLEEAVKIVKNEVRAAGNNYFQSMIDFGAAYEDDELVPAYEKFGNSSSPDVDASSWLGFEFEEVDFGGGGDLLAVIPSWIPCDGCIIWLPSMVENGGIDVLVGLLDEHASILKVIAYQLD